MGKRVERFKIIVNGKIENEKKCLKCGKIYIENIENFNKSGKYFFSYCKKCNYAVVSDWKKNNKDIVKIKNAKYCKKYREKNKNKMDNKSIKYYFARKKYAKNMIKWCPECENYKSKTDFLQQRGSKDGLTDVCLNCFNKYSDVKTGGRKHIKDEFYYC